MTTTGKEQEAFGLVIERHKNEAPSENEIRTAFQRSVETADIAAASKSRIAGYNHDQLNAFTRGFGSVLGYEAVCRE